MPESQTSRPVALDFSHIGIGVLDIKRMVSFYTKALGFVVTDHGVVRGNEIYFLTWDPREHHQLVLVASRTTAPDVTHLNQISFRVASLQHLQEFWNLIRQNGEIGNLRQVDHGNAWSIYFVDPEGNRIEVFCDSEWHVPQPCERELDLSKSVVQIRQHSENVSRASPGFRTAAEFQADVEAKLRAGSV